MYFLGLASNFSAKSALRQLFTFGSPKNSRQLKSTLASHYGALSDHVALTSSGRAALALALKASIPKNSKVIVNGFTCYAVLEALKSAHCTPIFADISTSDLNFSLDTLKDLFKKHPDTKAIIIQNSLGHTIDIRPFEDFAHKHSLVIIEDLAHCAGMLYPDGRETGTVGDASALSFGKGKSIDTTTGGAVILKNPNLPPVKAPTRRESCSASLRARWYPFLGLIARASFHIHCEKLILGIFFKLHWIERSADTKINLTTRPAHWQAKLTLEQIATFPHKTPLRDFALVNNREQVLSTLKRNGYAFSDNWYETPIAPARYYKRAHFPESDCPNSVLVAKSIINIPTWYNKSDLSSAYKIIKEAQK